MFVLLYYVQYCSYGYYGSTRVKYHLVLFSGRRTDVYQPEPDIRLANAPNRNRNASQKALNKRPRNEASKPTCNVKLHVHRSFWSMEMETEVRQREIQKDADYTVAERKANDSGKQR